MNARDVRKAHTRVDAHMAKAGRISAEAGHPVTCRGSGCFACCKEPVYAERREAELIVASLPMREMLAVRERVKVWWAGFFGGKFDRMESPTASRTVGLAFLRYRSANLWCPLLSEGKCVVYADRPASCRQHAAVGDPGLCEDDGQRAQQKYLYTDADARISAETSVTMTGGYEQSSPVRLDFDHLGVWLGRILLGEKVRSEAAQSFVLEIDSTILK